MEQAPPSKEIVSCLKKTYPNHGKRWTEEEENFLRESKDRNINEISEKLGRTPFAIFSRFFHLTSIGYDQNICETAAKLHDFFRERSETVSQFPPRMECITSSNISKEEFQRYQLEQHQWMDGSAHPSPVHSNDVECPPREISKSCSQITQDVSL